MSMLGILKACCFFVLSQSAPSVPIYKCLQEEKASLEERTGIAFSKGFDSLCAFTRESQQLGHEPKGHFFKESSNSFSWSFEILLPTASFYKCDPSELLSDSEKLLLVIKRGEHSENREKDCRLLQKELTDVIFTLAISDYVDCLESQGLGLGEQCPPQGRADSSSISS